MINTVTVKVKSGTKTPTSVEVHYSGSDKVVEFQSGKFMSKQLLAEIIQEAVEEKLKNI